jgi:polyferredoxin
MDKTKTLETSLVITTGFLVIYLITNNRLFLYLAFAFGVTGIFIKPLAKYIAIAWFKLADILNYFVSKIILGTLFFIVLFPVSLLYKITNKDKLRLKRSKSSLWIERNHTYSSADLENIW